MKTLTTTQKVLLGFVILDVPLVLMAWFLPLTMPPLLRQGLIAVWGVFGSLFVEMWLFNHTIPQALRQLGYGRPVWRAVWLALLITLPLWFTAPGYALITGETLTLNPNLFTLITGVVLINGLAEETVLRGFTFGHLREAMPFGRAATISALLFAAQHLYLIAIMGSVAGIAAVIFAAVVSYPMAYLFERGGRTIWAPAVMHAIVNGAGGLFVLSGDGSTVVILIHMAVAMIMSGVCMLIAYRDSVFAQTRRQILTQAVSTSTPATASSSAMQGA